MTEAKTEIKRGRGRVRKEAGNDRPLRVPVGGHRDKLTVQGRDPDKYYRWVLDMDQAGGRILTFLQAGYSFTDPANIIVGQTFVFNSPDHGSIVRRAGNKLGDYLYLMELPMTLREQDLAAHSATVDQTEQALYNPEHLQEDIADGGIYGGLKLS